MLERSNHSRSQRLTVAVIILLVLHPPIFGQDSFVAIPPAEALRYKIDFARNFFVSPEAEIADRIKLYATVAQLQTLKGKVAATPHNLERALQLNEQVQVQLRRHYAYLYLRNAVNTTDEASLAESSKLDAEIDWRTAFFATGVDAA